MRSRTGVALVGWCVLLCAVFAWPALVGSSNPGDDLTRNTVRLALLFYGITAFLLLLRRGEGTTTSGRADLARVCWTLAWAAYLVHLAMAFHYYHGWSHPRAVEHVRA